MFAVQIRQRYQSEAQIYTTTLLIIKRGAQMIRRHCQSSEARRYENAFKAWRDTMTRNNMMTLLFNLLKRLIDEANNFIGSPFIFYHETS